VGFDLLSGNPFSPPAGVSPQAVRTVVNPRLRNKATVVDFIFFFDYIV
jgi:hypothetical protein